MLKRPTIFVGSSTEGLAYAKALQVNLDRLCQVVIWSQGIFGLNNGTLEDLVQKLETVDFAALIVTPDDLIESSTKKSARDRSAAAAEWPMGQGCFTTPAHGHTRPTAWL